MIQDVRATRVFDIGEKTLIERFLRPLFNPSNDKDSVGDDCAVVQIPSGSLALVSTDRVPADLISFRAGLLDFHGIGRYLGVLNLSDVAACGGVPVALLLNCGLPSQCKVDDVLAVASGFHEIASRFGAKVMGGDITSSSELSLSATVLGHVEAGHVLRRSGAGVGDSVFISREPGLTPLALHYCLKKELFGWLSSDEMSKLKGQFASITPEINLGRELALSGDCTSCMDNTDGIAQSLSELARESTCAVIVYEEMLQLGTLVTCASKRLGMDAVELALGPGADFGLIGTLRGNWSEEAARTRYGAGIRIVGEVVRGSGLYLRRRAHTEPEPLNILGWNYFS